MITHGKAIIYNNYGGTTSEEKLNTNLKHLFEKSDDQKVPEGITSTEIICTLTGLEGKCEGCDVSIPTIKYYY